MCGKRSPPTQVALSEHQVETALSLKGRSRGSRASQLFQLVSGGPSARIAGVLDIMETLQRELPEAMSRKTPLRVRDFGFVDFESMVQYIGEALFTMNTSAASRSEFLRGIRGWRWNFVGRVLFERLVSSIPSWTSFSGTREGFGCGGER